MTRDQTYIKNDQRRNTGDIPSDEQERGPDDAERRGEAAYKVLRALGVEGAEMEVGDLDDPRHVSIHGERLPRHVISISSILVVDYHRRGDSGGEEEEEGEEADQRFEGHSSDFGGSGTAGWGGWGRGRGNWEWSHRCFNAF